MHTGHTHYQTLFCIYISFALKSQLEIAFQNPKIKKKCGMIACVRLEFCSLKRAKTNRR